ncbi:MAG: hypothetical protein ACFFCW_18385 [Candidatus Hodarchaeota archaeon]
MSEYKKQTDEIHKVTLNSEITHAYWTQKIVMVGNEVSFGVWTHYVGNGSDIDIKIEDQRGKTIEKLKGKVFGDQFMGTIVVPEKAKEELTFTAKLKKHGLEKKSKPIKVIPPIKVWNLKWGQKEARRGDVVKLSADIEGVPDETEVMLVIYEYDQDGAHDFITKFPCRVKNKKIEAEWEYEYHEDTDEIPTQEEKQRYGRHYNPPEYFFVIDVYRQRFGDKQESGLLEFKDWIEIRLYDGAGDPIPDEDYVLQLSDGTKRDGKLGSDGTAIEKDIPPGKVYVSFPSIQSANLLDKTQR